MNRSQQPVISSLNWYFFGAPGRIRTRDPLLRRSVCAAGQPACPQVSRCIGLSGSDRKYPALTVRSGTQRARRPVVRFTLGSRSAMDVGDRWSCSRGLAEWRQSKRF